MFDPHRTRRNESRYYTRKGQVLQASRVNVQPVIEHRLVPIYRNFLINNGLVYDTPQPGPIQPISISGVSIDHEIYLFSNMTKSTEPTVNLSYTAQGYRKIIIVFYKDTNGNHYLEVSHLDEDHTYTKTINNNAACYFLAISNTLTLNQTQLDTIEKGIVDELAANDILVFRGRSISLTTEIPLSII